jgi:hypothetical protein
MQSVIKQVSGTRTIALISSATTAVEPPCWNRK